MKALEDLTEPELRSLTTSILDGVKGKLPTDTGFAVLFWPTAKPAAPATEPAPQPETRWPTLKQTFQDLGKLLRSQDDSEPPSPYHVRIEPDPNGFIDLYAFCHAQGLTSQPAFEAIKKLLKAGKRGPKNSETDLQEALRSVQRAIELSNTQKAVAT